MNIDQSAQGKENLVTTPGGPRQESLVHEIDNNHVLKLKDGTCHRSSTRRTNLSKSSKPHPEKERTWQVIDHANNTVKDVKVRAASDVPAFGTGWIANTFWNNTTGSPISSFTTTWKVPPPPNSQSGQLLYLFNGVQTQVVSTNPSANGIHILQPVLRWGNSPAGGGNS